MCRYSPLGPSPQSTRPRRAPTQRWRRSSTTCGRLWSSKVALGWHSRCRSTAKTFWLAMPPADLSPGRTRRTARFDSSCPLSVALARCRSLLIGRDRRSRRSRRGRSRRSRCARAPDFLERLLQPVVDVVWVLHAAVRALTIIVQPAVGALAVVVQPAVRALTVIVQPAIGALTVVVQPAVGALTIIVQPAIGPLAVVIETTVGALAITVQAAVGALTIIVQPAIGLLAVVVETAVRALTIRIVQRVERKRRRIDDVQLVVGAEDDRTRSDVAGAQPRDLGTDVTLRRSVRDRERLPIDEDAFVVGDGTSRVLRLGERHARHA